MIYKSIKAKRNADGSFSVNVDGKGYLVSDMTELIHFLKGENYEGTKEADNVNDSERESTCPA